MAENAEWVSDGARALWPAGGKALAVVDCHDSSLVLEDGRELVDGVAAWGTVLHGYKHPALVDALRAQSESLPHVLPAGLVSEAALKLAGRLAAHLPGALSHVMFSDSGMNALEAARIMAQLYWRNAGHSGKTKSVTFRGSAHIRSSFVCDLPDSPARLKALDAFLTEHGGKIASMIVEPLVQSAGRMAFQHVDLPKLLRALADKHKILLIFDECFTGMGRLGTLCAAELAETPPDILCLGRGLSGGVLPLAATVTSEDVYTGIAADAAGAAVIRGPGFAGNALACAAALASLDLIETKPRLRQCHELAQVLAPALGPCLHSETVRDVRVRGGVAVVELAHPIADPAALSAEFAEMGVFLRPFGSVICLTPPLTISQSDLARLTESVRVVVKNPQYLRKPG